MEFQADIMVSKGRDKLQKRSTVYTIIGDPGEGGVPMKLQILRLET